MFSRLFRRHRPAAEAAPEAAEVAPAPKRTRSRTCREVGCKVRVSNGAKRCRKHYVAWKRAHALSADEKRRRASAHRKVYNRKRRAQQRANSRADHAAHREERNAARRAAYAADPEPHKTRERERWRALHRKAA